MKTSLKSALLVAFASLTLPTIASASPPRLQAQISGGGWIQSISGTTTTTGGLATRTGTGSINQEGRSGSGQAKATATFGALRVYGNVQMTSSFGENTVGGRYGWAHGYARFRDNRVTHVAGREGQQGYVTIKYTVTGSNALSAPFPPDPEPSSRARAIVFIRLNGAVAEERSEILDSDGNPCEGIPGCGPFLNVEQTYTYPVTFGTPYDFEFEIGAAPTIWVFRNNSIQASVDLGHTMVWGGIASVTDANGNPISEWTETSESGVNYKQPIAPVCAAPPASLTGWWPGDNHARDIDSGNNGVLENGATYATGQVGQAFSFNGSGARVHVPHAATLDFNSTQDYTIDFWMKAAPQPASATLVEKNGGTFPYAIRLLPNGTINASAYDGTSTVGVTSTSGSGAAAAGVVHDNLWHHIAVVFNHSSKKLELYVDGALNASQTYTETLGTLANGQDLYFGARGDSSNSYNGLLDEVDIASGAFSLSEIQAIVLANQLGKCRPPVIATGAVSRKTHGSEGDFDVSLPLTGTTGVECRSGGATRDYTVVVNFDSPIAFEGTPQAEIAAGSANIGSGGTENGGVVSVNGTSVTIPLTNVANEQTLSIKLNAVSNGASVADVFIPLSVLVGDTNADRAVNAGDALQTRTRSGQAAAASTFRSDVNGDGTVNSGDATAVRSRSGTSLP